MSFVLVQCNVIRKGEVPKKIKTPVLPGLSAPSSPSLASGDEILSLLVEVIHCLLGTGY